MTLENAQAELNRLLEALPEPAAFPSAGSRLVIYGAGNFGRHLLEMLQQGGWQVEAIIDAKAQGEMKIGSVPCVALQHPLARELASQGLPVILAIFNYATDCAAIALQLRETGFGRVIPAPDLYERFSGEMPPGFWVEKPQWFRQHRSELFACLELWEDDLSREIFLELVAFRLSHDFRQLRAPDRDGQYFPADLPGIANPIRFVDGGAFVGDSLPALFAHEVEALAAFEPDLANFAKLSAAVKNLELLPKATALYPCGLDETTGLVAFNSGNSAASAIAENGGSVIPVVALDDVLPGFAPTYIKLDIEGAELRALRGARNTIQEHQPTIAACIYHTPAHLWEVPMLLKELAPGNRLYLRSHGFNCFDSVAYSIPPAPIDRQAP